MNVTNKYVVYKIINWKVSSENIIKICSLIVGNIFVHLKFQL